MKRSYKRPSTIKEQVYHFVKSDILTGVYKPGDRIKEGEIASRLQVSRSPVREALKELVGEGLIQALPNKGLFVKKLTRKEILDVLDFRMIVEKYSIRKTIERASNEDINTLEKLYIKMEEYYRKGDINNYSRVDASFHNTLYQLSGNEIIYELVQNIFYLFQPFRTISLSSQQRFKESLSEHKQIMEGLKQRNFEKAWESAKQHLELATVSVLKFLETWE